MNELCNNKTREKKPQSHADEPWDPFIYTTTAAISSMAEMTIFFLYPQEIHRNSVWSCRRGMRELILP